MIVTPGMCQNTVRETAFFNDYDKGASRKGAPEDAMMEELDVLVLDGEHTNFDENVYDDDDDDDDSWGLMDQADQEAIEYEEEVLSEQSSSTSTFSENEGGDYEQWHSAAERDDVDAYGDSRAVSPALWRGDRLSDEHRFIITPERRPTTIEVVVTEDTEDWDDDDDDMDDDSAQLPLDRLSLLMQRSDQSRRCLQERNLPTRFYGSSRFFTIAIDRQKLRRMMNDA